MYIKCLKNERMLIKGVHFHLYLPVMTIYMLVMITVRPQSNMEQVIVVERKNTEHTLNFKTLFS